MVENLEDDLVYSYLMLYENQEIFKHQESPLSGNSIVRKLKFNWFPISTQLRTDSVKKVTATDIQQSYYRFGFGFSTQKETIYQCRDAKSRILPYENNFLNSVTYEIETTRYLLIKREYSILDYFTSLGGLGSLLLGISTILNALESP